MIGAYLIVSLAVMLVLMSTTPVAMAIPGQLRLSTLEGSYVESSPDAWLHESWVTTATSFNLDITNHNGGDIYHLYLLVAVDRDPEDNVTVEVDNNPVYPPYSGYGTILNNGKAEVPQAIVPPHNNPYEYPGHGIYNNESVDTHFKVVEILLTDKYFGDGDSYLEAGETITVPVEITLLTTEWVKVHFDAVGADSSYTAIAFVPPSEDVTYVPEFTTIAIPVAAILGLLFFFNHRKRRKAK